MSKKVFLFIISLSIICVSLFSCKNEQDIQKDYKENDFVIRKYEVNISLLDNSTKSITPEIYMVKRQKKSIWTENEYTCYGSDKLTNYYTVSKCEELVSSSVDYDASDVEYSFVVKIGEFFYTGFSSDEKCLLRNEVELDSSKVVIDKLGVLSAYDSCTSLMTTVLEEELSDEINLTYAVGSYIMHFIVNIDIDDKVTFHLNKFINTVEEEGVETKIKVISK